MVIELTNAARKWLGDQGYDPFYGARPLKRVIQKNVLDELAREILDGRVVDGQTVKVDVKGGKIALSVVSLYKPSLPQISPIYILDTKSIIAEWLVVFSNVRNARLVRILFKIWDVLFWGFPQGSEPHILSRSAMSTCPLKRTIPSPLCGEYNAPASARVGGSSRRVGQLCFERAQLIR